MKSIQDAIESLHAKELCPRLHVDVTHADAVCPDFVQEKWQQRLVIDLDPSYPLDLAFTKVGVEADLSFGGYVTRCVFPWAAIYVVADRATGRGQVFASNIPASLRHEFGAPAISKGTTIDPELTKVRDDDAKPGARRRKRRGAAEPSAPVGLRPVADPEDDEDEDEADTGEAAAETEAVAEAETESTETEADAPETASTETPSAEETARARRSAFKVLDGGS